MSISGDSARRLSSSRFRRRRADGRPADGAGDQGAHQEAARRRSAVRTLKSGVLAPSEGVALASEKGSALAGAATALKERERDDRDDEIARLKSKVGEITMDNELLYAKIEALEGKRPLAHRRSRR